MGEEKPPCGAAYPYTDIFKEFAMGIFRTAITLENPFDVALALRGFIKESEVRRLTVDALVDTGAWTLVINEKVRAELGLEVMYESKSEVANGVVETGYVTKPVTIYWEDRDTDCRAFVLSNEPEVLLGALPLEEMDLMVYPNGKKLVGAHGDKPLYIVK
jgi:clan AA aspartic protease